MRTCFFASMGAMILTSSLVAANPGGDVVLRSGPARVALIELYTSEGCSSCPPAEQWLGELRSDAGLWKDFVPVAFHVNYWDHLGWRDVLASKSYTDREYAYAETWRASAVYTPCFVRNGQEWRPRGRTGVEPDARSAGAITLRWQAGTRSGRVEFAPAAEWAKASKLEVSIALLGSGIVSNVRKGENAGRELRHEFVALQLETAALTHRDDGTWVATVSLRPRGDITAPRQAIAAWISPNGQLAPIQAVGGWIE